ncbi:MAG: hypothetical protein R6V76_12590 [Desulfobacterales bacterium]
MNEKISCGACCGLYNVPDLSCDKLYDMLIRRTTGFSKVPREVEAITNFGEEVLYKNNKRPYHEFYHCPFIGLIGNDRMRVGCLLHPLSNGNNGIDYRGLSYYGSMTCNIYFCPSYTMLPENYKRIIRKSADDWYSYGLIITEIVLINAFFSEIENHLQRKIDETDIHMNQTLIGIIKEFIGFKAYWPFRPPSDTAANYFFKDKLYERKPVDYNGIRPDSPTSRYDIIFRELGSSFNSVEEIRHAESMIEDLLKRAGSIKI